MLSFLDIFALLIGSLTFSAGLMVVLSRNLTHAVVFLGLTLLGVSAEMALLQAHVLAVLQLVLVGGTLFVLLLYLSFSWPQDSNTPLRLSGKGILLVVLMGTTLMAAGGVGFFQGKHLRRSPPTARQWSSLHQHRVQILQRGHSSSTPRPGSALAFSRVLTTQTLLAFELVGVLLLLGLFGCLLLLRNSPATESES